MNRTTIIIVACGFFFALMAAMAVQMIGAKSRAKNAPQTQVAMADVLIAAKDLSIGEELKDGAATWSSWPKNAVFPGAVTRAGQQSASEALEGRVRRAIAKGEPILKSALVEETKGNFVAASLTPGNRAVAVSVNAQSSVAGFVMPNDRVDIVLTYDVKIPSDPKIKQAASGVVNKMAAETILENIRVLAADQDASKKTEAKVNKTVTLEVTSKQAETLILAGRMGNLSLVLRGIGDDALKADNTTPTPTTTDLRLSGVMHEIMKDENNTGSMPRIVRIYNGNRIENVEVRPYSPDQ